MEVLDRSILLKYTVKKKKKPLPSASSFSLSAVSSPGGFFRRLKEPSFWSDGASSQSLYCTSTTRSHTRGSVEQRSPSIKSMICVTLACVTQVRDGLKEGKVSRVQTCRDLQDFSKQQRYRGVFKFKFCPGQPLRSDRTLVPVAEDSFSPGNYRV